LRLLFQSFQYIIEKLADALSFLSNKIQLDSELFGGEVLRSSKSFYYELNEMGATNFLQRKRYMTHPFTIFSDTKNTLSPVDTLIYASF
jgi:hypothetical protein